MSPRLRAALLAGAAILAGPQPSVAQSFSQFVTFGDSNVDSGWWTAWLGSGQSTGNTNKDNRINTAIAAGGTGAPVGNGYLMNSQILASYFGLTATPANQAGGTNYAIAGALDAAQPSNGNVGNLNNVAPNTNTGLPSTVQQIANYLASTGGTANSNALYLISSGGNDVSFAVDNFGTNGARFNYLSQQASRLTTAVQTLQAAGARYILVQTNFFTNGFANFYNQTLFTDLTAAGIQFIPVDRQAMVRVVEANPTMFGFTAATVLPATVGSGAGNTTSACIYNGPSVATVSGWSQFCLNTTTPSATLAYLRSADSQQTSFFSDDQHFSAAGQKIEADFMYNLVVAPSQISFFAELPVKTRANAVNAILNQIGVSFDQVGAFHGWVTGDLSWLKLTNSYNGFPDDPGTPIAITQGFDYRLSQNWLVGVAFSGGATRQSFSTGGDYKMAEFAASLYAAFRNGPYWANAVGSVGWMQFSSNRQLPIGISTQANLGNTSGSNFSFAFETGYNFNTKIGARGPAGMPVKAASSPVGLTHGPVAGIVLQQVRVAGFTETDQFASIGGFTALSFGDQTRNSAVSELGWQVSYDAAWWKPFAKAVWNHELANTDRSITTTITTLASAPAYAMPAVVFGRDWGTATVGATAKMSKFVTGVATVTGQFAEHNVATVGAQIGFNVSLSPDLVRARF